MRAPRPATGVRLGSRTAIGRSGGGSGPGKRDTGPAAAGPDVPTIVAIASVAYAGASFLHEVLGHGGACWLTGQRLVSVSAVDVECEDVGPIVASAGTIANLIAGVLCLLASRRSTLPVHVRYLLWLSMTINLLQAAVYLAYSGVTNVGDWAVVVWDQRPLWLWRIALTGLGVGLYRYIARF